MSDVAPALQASRSVSSASPAGRELTFYGIKVVAHPAIPDGEIFCHPYTYEAIKALLDRSERAQPEATPTQTGE